MPYTLLKTNGQKLTVVEDSTVDKTTDLLFVGKNYTGYGSPVNENFLKLLENFSNTTAPIKPIKGQLWFDSSSRKLKIYEGRIFRSLGFLESGPIAPAASVATRGDLWYNTNDSKLYIYNTLTGWNSVSSNVGVGIASTGSFGTVEIKDTNLNSKRVVPIAVSGSTATIISTSSLFIVDPAESVKAKFPRIYPGINIASTDERGISSYIDSFNVRQGNLLWGTAASALGLVSYTGTQASLILPGDLILRSEFFNGSPALNVTDNEGITIGSQKVLKIHINPSGVANISLINGTLLQVNLNTVNGTYTNIISFDGSSGLKVLPNLTLPVSLGDSSRRFNTIFGNTVNSSLVSASAVNAATVSATSVAATTMTSTVISGGAIYDNGFRVLTENTLPKSGVASVSGTFDQILVNGSLDPSTGSVTISLPNTVNIDTLIAISINANTITVPNFTATTITGTIILGTAIYGNSMYDGGSRVITQATLPSRAVTSISGTARQILVNGGTAASSGTITLTLPQNVDTGSSVTFAGVSVGTGTITTRRLTAFNGTATVTGNWTLSSGTFQATYADLAERYASDSQYEPGTVLIFGGDNEVTVTDEYASTAIAGVVSTLPAYTMNASAGSSATHPYIALVGRVPCKVCGPVKKGDLLVTAKVPGYATAASGSEHSLAFLGRALENFDGDRGIVEIKVI